jgi:ketosteroid isomerase-like protein
MTMKQQNRDTAAVLHQFNEAFLRYDASLLEELVAEDCVMESVEPAPDGTRFVGRGACLAFWQRLANDRSGAFTVEEIAAFGDRGTILWRYRLGPDLSRSVRGATLMTVRNGQIVEALGYSKSGETPVATAVRNASQ